MNFKFKIYGRRWSLKIRNDRVVLTDIGKDFVQNNEYFDKYDPPSKDYQEDFDN